MKTLSYLTLAVLSALPCTAEPPVEITPPAIEEHLKNVPPYLLPRCTAERRLAAIEKRGGDPAAEKAVIDALRFLKGSQDKDGSWKVRADVGLTALSLLCFLGHGETTQSEEFGDTVKGAIEFLIQTAVKNRGKLTTDFRDHHWPYEHAIATYALAEAYALCEKGYGEEIKQLERAVEVCGQFIIDAQHQGGGWDYAYSGDSARGGDVSQTTWHLLALQACKYTGLDFTNLIRSSKKGLDYIERMQMASGAIGYSSPHLRYDGTALAALRATTFQIWKSPATKVARKAVRFIDKELEFDWNSPNADLYGLFFASQTMFRNDGPEWGRYQKMVFPQVLENQAPGGFFLAPNHGDRDTMTPIAPYYTLPTPYGVHYRTCLAILTLETHYRIHIPAHTK